MYKKIGIVLVILVILIVAGKLIHIDINFSRSYHHLICKSTGLSKENVNGNYLGEKINDFRIEEKYGEISELSHENIKYNYYFLTKYIEVATKKDNKKIIRFISNDKNIKTYRNCKIGDSKEKIIGLYGNNYYNRLEQGFNIIGYIDKDKNISLEFWLDENDCVSFYRLDYKFME